MQLSTTTASADSTLATLLLPASPKAGAAGSVFDLARDSRLNHRIAVDAGVGEDECRAAVQEFFRARRPRRR